MKKKKKNLVFLLLMTLLCLPLQALAVERDFPAGSLIIPMDSSYQPEDDGGILEAYGLAFALLSHTDGSGEHDITLYWVINSEKADIDANDFIIEVESADVLAGFGVNSVAKLYDHAGGTSALTYKAGDSSLKVSYLGAPFIIDAEDAEAAKSIIDLSGWAAVEVHEAKVPFAAPVFREMRGTPPRIAVMDSKEDGGNAKILVNYLRLAGICDDLYDVVSPNQVKDGILADQGYDVMWVPHWHGDTSDNDNNGIPDAQDVVNQVRLFVESGKGLVAECASIAEFEHRGRFLTTADFGHDGGTNDADTIIYHDVSSPNAQIGDYPFEPEGGSLHNWRPFVAGDGFDFSPSPDEFPAGDPEVTADNPSLYNDTVTRFTVDDTGWDYYVGGYADGDSRNGYVVYMGGHSYASCGSPPDPDPHPNATDLLFEFSKDINIGTYTLLFSYNSGLTTTVTFGKLNLTAKTGSPLEVDLTAAEVNGKKLENVIVRNLGSSGITVDSITASWENENNQELKKIENTEDGEKLYDSPEVVSGTEIFMADELQIPALLGASLTGCTDNDDCSAKNIGAVRYMLNTLFNITFQISSREYVRSAPIVRHPYLYQGSFEWPSHRGHFRRFDVTEASDSADWDTADAGKIAQANDGNASGRKVHTAVENLDGSWSTIDFDVTNLGELRAPLNVSPQDGDDTHEIAVITRVRGKHWNSTLNQWDELGNKLGGILHSAPAIVFANSRADINRQEIAYVGDLYGMLHAINTATGSEKWAYIPRNLLGKLKNVRTDPNATQDFAAVDGSPAAKDVFYDYDQDVNTGDPETGKEWRTILVSPEGYGGRAVFALDVTDPDDLLVLWEVTADAILHYTGAGGFSAGDAVKGQTSGASGKVVADDTETNELTLEEVSGDFHDGETVFRDANNNGAFDGGEDTITVSDEVEMGHAYRASLNKVKWPVDGGGYEPKWVVFVATGHARIAEDHGGINVFAFDLLSGERLWYFSADYADSVNDIPGAVTAFDLDADNLVDRLYVGDMNGRMWELNAADGSNPHGTDGSGKQIPLWNVGVGYPISVSPAITRNNASHAVVIFGTGGADWAPEFDPGEGDQPHAVYAVDATELQESPDSDSGAGTLLWQLDLAKGEKVWSAPTIAANQIYVATAFGTMESSDPRSDLPSEGESSGNLHNINQADGTVSWSINNIGKARGSVYVEREHVYLTTVDNSLIQVGGSSFPEGSATNVILRDWKDF